MIDCGSRPSLHVHASSPQSGTFAAGGIVGTRDAGRLTALGISRLTAEGMYADGRGLYLQIGKGGARSWIYRFQVSGKSRYLGLGSAHVITLKMARERAAEARLQRATGIDPVEVKKALLQPSKALGAKSFRKVADDYIAQHEAGWTRQHSAQWAISLRTDVYPWIGDMPVQDVDVASVLRCLQPIWNAKPETASRIRNRIELVLDAAKAHGLRDGENPARWRGHLDKLLPARRKLQRVEHFKAMPFDQVPALMTRLRQQDSAPARALELAILTATRANEVLEGRPTEIFGQFWVVPAERMKSRREHRVPLVGRALEIVQDCKGSWFFPGRYGGAPSPDIMRRLLRKMNVGYDVHGFRSSFRDWCAECTNFPRELAEKALAHVVGDETERAYQRGDLLMKRIALMRAWHDYCAGQN